jgi:hypothetical protein
MRSNLRNLSLILPAAALTISLTAQSAIAGSANYHVWRAYDRPHYYYYGYGSPLNFGYDGLLYDHGCFVRGRVVAYTKSGRPIIRRYSKICY